MLQRANALFDEYAVRWVAQYPSRASSFHSPAPALSPGADADADVVASQPKIQNEKEAMPSEEEEHRSRRVQSLHTLTFFFLAQIYGHLGNAEMVRSCVLFLRAVHSAMPAQSLMW